MCGRPVLAFGYWGGCNVSQVSYHLVTPTTDGFSVNKTALGSKCPSLPDLIEYLAVPRENGWSAELRHPIPGSHWTSHPHRRESSTGAAAQILAYPTLSTAFPSTIGMFGSAPRDTASATPLARRVYHLHDQPVGPKDAPMVLDGFPWYVLALFSPLVPFEGWLSSSSSYRDTIGRNWAAVLANVDIY
jgi:hypothetical protein